MKDTHFRKKSTLGDKKPYLENTDTLIKSELDEEGRKLFSIELNQKENENYNNEGSLENQLLELKSLLEKDLIPEDIYLKKYLN